MALTIMPRTPSCPENQASTGEARPLYERPVPGHERNMRVVRAMVAAARGVVEAASGVEARVDGYDLPSVDADEGEGRERREH